MIGVTSYGAYVPRTRLPLALAAGRPAAKDGSGPERAVAGHDEDALTMAVAAGIDALGDADRARIDAIHLATTTSPYREKLGAALVAKALDLRRDVASTDFGGGLRAGTAALRAAFDAVAAGSARAVLVVASDVRPAAPHSGLERAFGDAAAAFVVGHGAGVVAAFEAAHAVSDEILDVWRTDDAPFVRSWEERFAVDHGYHRNVLEAVHGLFARTDTDATDYRRLVLYGPDERSHARAARVLGFADDAVEPALLDRLGNAGTAHALLLLAAALARGGAGTAGAAPTLAAGDRVLVVSYGNGAEALALRGTAALATHPARRGVARHLARRRAVRTYGAHLAARHLEAREHDPREGGGVPATVAYRDRDHDVSLLALRCRRCTTTHFPRHRVCYRCGARDDFEPVRLSDRVGRLRSFTFDWFFPSPEPPTGAGVVEVEGCRMLLQLADVAPDEVALDLPVELVFRRIHEAGGRPAYFWKAAPRWDEEAAP